MSHIRVVFFDLGGVMVNLHLDRFFTTLAKCCNKSADQIVAITKSIRNEYQHFERGLCTSEDIFQVVRQQYQFPGNVEEFETIYTDIFSLNTDVAALVQELSASIKVSIISNTDELHFGYLNKNYPVMSLFTHPITSFQVHSLKPEPEIYRAGLRALKVQAGEAFFIDDKNENIAAAQDVGMHGMLFSDAAALRQELDRLMN